jgi:hypothetical protein
VFGPPKKIRLFLNILRILLVPYGGILGDRTCGGIEPLNCPLQHKAPTKQHTTYILHTIAKLVRTQYLLIIISKETKCFGDLNLTKIMETKG